MPKFEIARHAFTTTILAVLQKHFGEYAHDIFAHSSVLGYLNSKTKAANRGSKARAAFANHYALYVVVEDYIQKGFVCGLAGIPYAQYEGARFTDLLRRQRALPFGTKLQNHALNSRLNEEFRKFYPSIDKPLIIRDMETQRYWVQESLLRVTVRHKNGKDRTYNIACAIIDVIDAYIKVKRAAFDGFLHACQQIAHLGKEDPDRAIAFVTQQLEPNVDARIFEIVSYAVLKDKFGQESVWIGNSRERVSEVYLALYKTGRTNANDGGIDFVMKPLGRFFQVTETTDLNKYFLDIYKIQRFPVSFVVKSSDSVVDIRAAIRTQARARYGVDAVVDRYMNAIEDIINTKALLRAFNAVVASGKLQDVMDEIILQSKLEFNYPEGGGITEP